MSNQQELRRKIKAIRKRFRSDSTELEQNKRQRELIDGDLEDFLDYLDCFQYNSELIKPVAKDSESKMDATQPTTSQLFQSPPQKLTSLLDPSTKMELLELFSPILVNLEARFSSNLDKHIQELKDEIKEKDTKIKSLENRVDELEQRTRMDTLRFHGIKEGQNENTDTEIIKTVKENLDIVLDPRDISISHRIGTPGSDNRPILVKFTRLSDRTKVFRAKKVLKNKITKLFMSEDLTKKKADFFKQVRDLRNDGYILRTWTSDGKIFYVLNENDKPTIISTDAEIKEIRDNIIPTPRQQTTERK